MLLDRRGHGSPRGQRRGGAKLPQGFKLAVNEISHAGELRRHDLLDSLSRPGQRLETGCEACSWRQGWRNALRRHGGAGLALAPRNWRGLGREVFRRKVQMPGHLIERPKVAHHLAKAHGNIEAGLDGLARLREEQGIKAEFKETCAARRVGDVDARKIFEQGREFALDRRLPVGRLRVLPYLGSGGRLQCFVRHSGTMISFKRDGHNRAGAWCINKIALPLEWICRQTDAPSRCSNVHCAPIRCHSGRPQTSERIEEDRIAFLGRVWQRRRDQRRAPRGLALAGEA